MSENVKVKPLVWVGGQGYAHAYCVFGKYTADTFKGRCSARLCPTLGRAVYAAENMKTKKQAKAACQRDYERRVLELLQ